MALASGESGVSTRKTAVDEGIKDAPFVVTVCKPARLAIDFLGEGLSSCVLIERRPEASNLAARSTRRNY
jgi:hypothetical protein